MGTYEEDMEIAEVNSRFVPLQTYSAVLFYCVFLNWECVRFFNSGLCCGCFQGCYRYIKKIFQQLEVINAFTV